MSADLMALMARAKAIACEYYRLTGRPLGITGEVAEVAAVAALGLEMSPVRQEGYDATRPESDGTTTRLQIKGRCTRKDANAGQRVGSIRLDKEWDAVLLVLLDENFELIEIWEAERGAVVEALQRPGSVARNERGALGVNAFKRIGRKLWPTESVPVAQDKESGIDGHRFGHDTAPLITEMIGATMIGEGTNEASWEGKRVVIKCANTGTSSVGVTKTMLGRLDSVLAAFLCSAGNFEVFEMSAETYAAQMRPSKSSGSGARVGLVSRSAFKVYGKSIGSITPTDRS